MQPGGVPPLVVVLRGDLEARWEGGIGPDVVDQLIMLIVFVLIDHSARQD